MKLPFIKSDDEFTVLRRSLVTIQHSIDLFSRDMSNDREDISDLKIRMAKIEQQLEELLRRWSDQTQKIKETIESEVEPINIKIDQLTKEETVTNL